MYFGSINIGRLDRVFAVEISVILDMFFTQRLQQLHYTDFTWAPRRLKSPTIRPFIQQLIQADNKVNAKALHHWPFVKIHRMILTKG